MNYGRKKIAKKQKDITSKSTMQKRRIGVRLFKAVLLCLLVVFIIGCIGGVWFVTKIIDDAPQITASSVKPSGYITSVYADDGVTKTEEFLGSGGNRIYKKLDEIPKNLQNAFIAIEDSRFYTHNGIDMKGIFRAAMTGITNGHFSEGASTITQQLIKNNVFDFMEEKSFLDRAERKVQEQFLAVKLEKQMSKDEILENYLNTINLGQNTLGVEAASLRYFNKSVSELTLAECAVIAGITKSPGGYNPVTNPEENAKRRDKVLSDMVAQGYIDQKQADQAAAEDVYARIQTVNEAVQNDSPYSYFNDALAEQILKDLVKAGYTEAQAYKTLFTGGLSIYSTQNTAIQQITDEEVNDDSNYISNISWGISYLLTVTRADGSVENFGANNIKNYAKDKYGDEQGLLQNSQDECYQIIEEWKATIAQEGDKYDERITLTPQPQSSVTLIDQATGHIKALVGGRGPKTSSKSLNRAYTGSKRQPGSIFKVLAAFGPAIDSDQMSLATTIVDEPYNYVDGTPVKNWYSGYRGTATVRKAIEQSMNILAVKAITEITPQAGFDFAKKLGISTLVESDTRNGEVFSDIHQPLALGGITDGVYNYEIAAAFAAIANKGVYNEPVLYTKILDHDGNVLLENAGQNSRQAIRESTAFLLTDAMQDVITHGTGTEARLYNMPVSGKTGTTSEDKDVWFAGFTPYYTCAVWLGYDENLSMTGKWLSHMTLWKNIMNRVHEGLEYRDFEEYGDVQRITVCALTGKLASSSCPPRTEYFATSMVPTEYCPGHYVAPPPVKNTQPDDTPPQDPQNGNGEQQPPPADTQTPQAPPEEPAAPPQAPPTDESAE